MKRRSAFTIIELLVVVSIIALLMGILLPAIAASRDQAQVTRSQANLRQLAVAHATYASEWNDNQWTPTPHNLGTYGKSLDEAVSNYQKAFGNMSKSVTFDPSTGYAGVPVGSDGTGSVVWTAKDSHKALLPMEIKGGQERRDGYFRMINARTFNQYVSGRFYDETFFAPKDRAVIETIGECYDAPGEFCSLTGGKYGPVGSSYVLSPPALYTPDLFSQEWITGFTMWNMPALMRSPTFSQARYPELKSHMMEHHWLQNTPRSTSLCIQNAPDSLKEYLDETCAPYFFNASADSVPVTLFYDGHVAQFPVRDAKLANDTVKEGIWHNKTPALDVGYHQGQDYFIVGYPKADISHHMLTRYGILGRDNLSR